MLNILIISNEAKELYSLFKSAGFSPDTQDVRQQALGTKPAAPTGGAYRHSLSGS